MIEIFLYIFCWWLSGLITILGLLTFNYYQGEPINISLHHIVMILLLSVIGLVIPLVFLIILIGSLIEENWYKDIIKIQRKKTKR